MRIIDTFSVCPVCLRQLPAEKITSPDGSVRIRRVCPEHGVFESLVWRGRTDYADWCGGTKTGVTAAEGISGPENSGSPDCAHCRGLCASHRRGTCCTLLEVTKRCNLNCRFCFAGDRGGEDPSLARVKAWIFDLTEPGQTFLQLSGGEPTLRDDLPEIVAFAKQCGCRYIQLNTNGIRLAEDEDYVRRLARAGLSIAFLSFDGVTEEVYETLRGRPMLEVKEKAIKNCAASGIGVVLVPVIVRGVNDDQIGKIIEYTVQHAPSVKGIHFQPVSFFGKIPGLPEDRDRYTLDELMSEIAFQTGGRIPEDSLKPSDCDHPLCGFHGSYVVKPDRSLMVLSSRKNDPAGKKGTAGYADAECRSREFIGRHWSAAENERGMTDPNEPEVGNAGTTYRSAGDEKSVYRYFQRKIGGGEENRAARTESERTALLRRSAVNAEGESVPAEPADPGCSGEDLSDMDTFLARAKEYTITISSMDFQDAGNLDFERLRSCSLHVYRDGRKIPFCAYYLTPWPENRPGEQSFSEGGERI